MPLLCLTIVLARISFCICFCADSAVSLLVHALHWLVLHGSDFFSFWGCMLQWYSLCFASHPCIILGTIIKYSLSFLQSLHIAQDLGRLMADDGPCTLINSVLMALRQITKCPCRTSIEIVWRIIVLNKPGWTQVRLPHNSVAHLYGSNMA